MALNIDGVADVTDALHALRPGAEWGYGADVGLTWHSTDSTAPTQSEIDAKIIELQADYDAKQYQRDRAKAYPSIGDQLDMQYHDSINGTTTWADAIQAVKDAHPKP